MKHRIHYCLLLILVFQLAACVQRKKTGTSYAIYAELARDSNVLMRNGLNRRVFNTTEAEAGEDIRLKEDGSVSLQPGTYHISGFSLTTMQASLAIPEAKHGTNYPGYSIVYPKEHESDMEVLRHQIGIGTPSTARETVPSFFDMVYTCSEVREICVGHQSGNELNNEVYLSVYEVDSIPSDYHVFARIAIRKLAMEQ